MYAQYGSYIHPNHEVNVINFSQIPILSKRGKRREYINRIVIEGELQAEGQAALRSEIENIINVYSQDGLDFYYKEDDLTISPHSLISNHPKNLTGNRIVSRSWPKGWPGEYIVCRNFQIVIASHWHDAESDLVEFHETVQIIGDGGSTVEGIETRIGPPIIQQTNAQTLVSAVQTGRLYTMSSSPALFVPSPIWPRPLLKRISVQPISGRSRGRGYSDYGMAWNYETLSPAPLSGNPNTP